VNRLEVEANCHCPTSGSRSRSSRNPANVGPAGCGGSAGRLAV